MIDLPVGDYFIDIAVDGSDVASSRPTRRPDLSDIYDPSSVIVTSCKVGLHEAVMWAHDPEYADLRWRITLAHWSTGANYWFAQTIEDKVARHGEFELWTTYDERRDEWFARAGNYGIYSRDLSFERVEDFHARIEREGK